MRADSLARHLGLKTLYLKDDGRNPSGSLKDRASSVGVVKAREKRQKIIACASTGNAASSLAGMAASLGLRSVIFVPERAPEPKVTQLLIFGATVLRVRGSYEDAFQMCQGACERWGWYNRNSAINPYLVEGKKTVGLEICEQLDWQVPDWVAVSVGDGCTIAGGVEGLPRNEDAGAHRAHSQNAGRAGGGRSAGDHSVSQRRTAEAHRAADDCRQHRGGRAAQLEKGSARHSSVRRHHDQCGGRGNSRSHAHAPGRLTGIFAEPAAATAVAGVRRAVEEGIIGRKASVLAVVTGNGLKDIRSAQSAVTKPFDIAPDGTGLEEILKGRGLIS